MPGWDDLVTPDASATLNTFFCLPGVATVVHRA